MGKLPGLGARFGTYELLTAFYKGKYMISHDSWFRTIFSMSLSYQYLHYRSSSYLASIVSQYIAFFFRFVITIISFALNCTPFSLFFFFFSF